MATLFNHCNGVGLRLIGMQVCVVIYFLYSLPNINIQNRIL